MKELGDQLLEERSLETSLHYPTGKIFSALSTTCIQIQDSQEFKGLAKLYVFVIKIFHLLMSLMETTFLPMLKFLFYSLKG